MSCSPCFGLCDDALHEAHANAQSARNLSNANAILAQAPNGRHFLGIIIPTTPEMRALRAGTIDT